MYPMVVVHTKQTHVRLTLSSFNEVRLKLPTSLTQQQREKAEQIARRLSEELMPVEKTLRAKFKTESTSLILRTDARQAIYVNIQELLE